MSAVHDVVCIADGPRRSMQTPMVLFVRPGWGALGRVALLPGGAVICPLRKERDKPSTPPAAVWPLVLRPCRDVGALEYQDLGSPRNRVLWKLSASLWPEDKHRRATCAHEALG